MKRKPFLDSASLPGLALLVLSLVFAGPSVLASPTQPVGQSIDQSVGQSIGQSVGQPTSQPTSQFAQPPVLLSTRASASPRSQDGFYYFSIRLPLEAGRPLAAVTIDPQSRSAIAFDLAQTEAFLGEADQESGAADSLALAAVRLAVSSNHASSNSASSDATNSDAIQITFAQPIPPGTTFTIGLKPSQTPERRRYEFGVTAIPLAEPDPAPSPTGEPAQIALGQPEFLGTGEVSFRGQRYRDYPFWWRTDGLLSTWSEGDRRVLFWDLPPEFDPRLRRRN